MKFNQQFERELVRRAQSRWAKRPDDAHECAREVLQLIRGHLERGETLPNHLAEYLVNSINLIVDSGEPAQDALGLTAPDNRLRGDARKFLLLAAARELAKRRKRSLKSLGVSIGVSRSTLDRAADCDLSRLSDDVLLSLIDDGAPSTSDLAELRQKVLEFLKRRR